jgi:hypothetical protein
MSSHKDTDPVALSADISVSIANTMSDTAAPLHSGACPHGQPSRFQCTSCRTSLEQSLTKELNTTLPALLRQEGWGAAEVDGILEELQRGQARERSGATVQQLIPVAREGISATDGEEMETELQLNVTREMWRRVQAARSLLSENKGEI